MKTRCSSCGVPIDGITPHRKHCTFVLVRPLWGTHTGNQSSPEKKENKDETENGSVATVIASLKRLFPHGHKDFIQITLDELNLHSAKNKDYAEGGDTLGNFRRTETIKRLYPGLDWASDYGGAIDYMLKQFDAVLWNLAHNKGTDCESLSDKIRDISVYAKLIRIMLEEKEKREKT